MIVSNNQYLNILLQLDRSSIPFILSGSRTNHREKIESDYDFIVQYTPNIIPFIESIKKQYTGIGNNTENFIFSRTDQCIMGAGLDINTHSVHTVNSHTAPGIDICVVYNIQARMQIIDWWEKNIGIKTHTNYKDHKTIAVFNDIYKKHGYTHSTLKLYAEVGDVVDQGIINVLGDL